MGLPEHVAVERALCEFRCGRPVIMAAEEVQAVSLPVDGMSDDQLAAFRQLCAPAALKLVVTERRARSLGLSAAGPIGLAVGEADRATDILALAGDAPVQRSLAALAPGPNADAAIQPRKLAQPHPALLVAPL